MGVAEDLSELARERQTADSFVRLQVGIFYVLLDLRNLAAQLQDLHHGLTAASADLSLTATY